MNALTSWITRSLGRNPDRSPVGPASLEPTARLIPLQDAQTLLNPRHRQAVLAQITRLTGLPGPHHQALVLGPIQQYASFVQQLPASQAHHHAGLGGLLDHALEVIHQALLIRRGRLLPIGGEPERIARQHDLWTYAVAMAALLHDLGKPAVDQRVTLHRADGQSVGTWDPLAGPMTDVPHCHAYTVTYRPRRRHGFHERVTSLLVHHIMPARGLAWLASDQALFAQWVATLAGDMNEAGALGEIIQEADGLSVARNLGAGDSPRVAPARTRPLWERLLTGLRYLLDQGELPLNRNGAAGWLVGDDLWLVSKRAIDALRAHLIAEGHSGIPSSNDRIYDTLQEHGILEPCGERAIWHTTVAGAGWSHELTLIRIPVRRIWTEPDSRPGCFEGTVTPRAPDAREDIAHEPTEPDQNDAPQDQVGDLPSPTPAAPIAKDIAPPTEQEGPRPDNEHGPGLDSAPVSDSLQGEHHGDDDGPADAGSCFLQWLQREALARRMEVNTPHARIHVVEEGVLLVSPAVFKDYASQNPDHGSWEYVQKRFMKLRVHQKRPDGTNVHRYLVKGARRQSVVKGIVLPDVAMVFPGSGEKASVNPHLETSR
ncbi:TraI domain-containing protein [Ectothiorhodospira haloalkaliphila]|uniref:MobH family relaxase n=1 Tax=Ectothiorhodospira haloalkaliphila TaxID=421628 RepID=UPI001EE864CB|nr:MobH family relaxase [Ectothiorhodospira haloalkaliphila]MCG5526238.1 TraI domain-containing protein [Ectothiorhodospira haloalkaliphila]